MQHADFQSAALPTELPGHDTCAALFVIEFEVARKKTPREIRCSILLSGLVCFNSGDGIVAAEPAIEINLGAARRTEGMEFLQ